jgi:hypothetical protein
VGEGGKDNVDAVDAEDVMLDDLLKILHFLWCRRRASRLDILGAPISDEEV